jgi:histidine triad (HIT) family protein
MDHGCLFCRIAAREVPAELLHVSDGVIAFRDIDPKAPTHILLIPREHVASISDLRDGHAAMLFELLRVAAHLARAEGVDKSGWRLVANTGPDVGQSVHHLHFHLLGGRPLEWPPG